MYGFVPHCKQASLEAKIGSKQVETMVSTSDLGMTKGRVCTYCPCTHTAYSSSILSITSPVQMLHQLTARALIRDWSDGTLDANRMEHEVCQCVCAELSSYLDNKIYNVRISELGEHKSYITDTSYKQWIGKNWNETRVLLDTSLCCFRY